jgi:protein-disulfide isomerase-like protein with CxxC motif
MAETMKGRKLTLRELLDEIAADEGFTEEERELAKEKSQQLKRKSGVANGA